MRIVFLQFICYIEAENADRGRLVPDGNGFHAKAAARAHGARPASCLRQGVFLHPSRDETRKQVESMEKSELIEKLNKEYRALDGIFSNRKLIAKAHELAEQAEAENAKEYYWLFHGYALSMDKQYDEACECFKNAVDADSGFAYAWFELGNVYSYQKKYEEAVKCYNRAIEKDALFAAPWTGLGIINEIRKKPEEAMKCYVKATEVEPNSAAAWFNWAISITGKKNTTTR